MRLGLRLVLALLLAAAAVALIFSRSQILAEQSRFEKDLSQRATALAESLKPLVRELIGRRRLAPLEEIARRFLRTPFRVAFFDLDGTLLVASATNGVWSSFSPELLRLPAEGPALDRLTKRDGDLLHLFATPVRLDGNPVGFIAIVQDASRLREIRRDIYRHNFLRLLTLSAFIVLATFLVIRWDLIRPLEQVTEWVKSLRDAEPGKVPPFPRLELFGSLGTEVSRMARSLFEARSSAETEARLRLSLETTWTAQKLREHVRRGLGPRPLIVVSNREPYMHVRRDGRTVCVVPDGGLVTALDPVMRACRGTWIAHGAGDEDRATADPQGRLAVPPEQPLYTLRRVWLSAEEERGYYDGFSNEGLWPLCHIAHTRPAFRLDDWTYYRKVNERFADAVVEECRGTDAPLVLIQDYHFCLLPGLLKERLPASRVAIFWHIPWPNAEVFGICPWKEELLHGLLGADLVGFHTQYFCNNFLDTVDTFLEARINRETFAVERKRHTTFVRPFPISVAPPDDLTPPPDPAAARRDLLRQAGTEAGLLGLGVDRLDYTKGLPERLLAIERFFEKHPDFLGRMTFVQVASPSRTRIPRYAELVREVDAEVERINRRFAGRRWRPLAYLKGHIDHRDIVPFYAAADFCMVTSLHDGMNLVAKEYIASRADGDGVLILSRFTGASRELPDALLVNPYDIEAMADAVHTALTLPPLQRRERMRRMRQTVLEHNVYRWAADLVSTLVHLPPSAS